MVPKGIIKHVQIDGLDFSGCLVVLTMKSIEVSYQMLLGRPWLREAKVKHDRYRDKISFKKGKKKKYIQIGRNQWAIEPHHSPIYSETFNMARG